MKQLLYILSLLISAITFSQQVTQKNSVSQSPYLEVLQENATIPLKKSTAIVNITGSIAHIRLTQVYHNKGANPIEAMYVFPMSLQAAVHDMKMTVRDRVINAKILEKQQAAKVYNEAIQQGKRAAKLDQSRPNVFQMKVGNVMPGDEVAIDIYYTEMLLPTNGEYQYVIPGVVGPRFTGENSSAETIFAQPYTPKGVDASFVFDVQVTIHAGVTIQNVTSSSHKINVTFPQQNTAHIYLSKSNIDPANRDFILNYNVRGNAISSGLLLYEHNDEQFFAYIMEPPATVKPTQVTAREYLFIVDVSGSMNGYPLDVSKNLMRNLLCNLNEDDTFNVQLFASSSTIFSPTPVKANEQNVTRAISFLSTGQGGGGTQLLDALKVAYQLPRANEDSARSMVVITDGYVSVEKEAFQIIEQNLNKANVFTFGIGSSVNRYLIEGLAKVANSTSFVATTMEEAAVMANNFKNYIETPLLTQVSFSTNGFEVYDVEPKTIPDVFAARPVLIYGKYKGEAKGSIKITGVQGRKRVKQVFNVQQGTLSNDNKALRYLWARKKIERLDDYNANFYENVEQEVTQLGLQYNLATKYTSFVAIDEVAINNDGTLKTVSQPLPMPLHVSNSAVGATAEVTGTSVVSKNYALTFNDIQLPKTEIRKLHLWFKAHYGAVITNFFTSNFELRVKFGHDGAIVQVEQFNGTHWISNTKILNEFKKVLVHKVPTSKQFTAYVKAAQ